MHHDNVVPGKLVTIREWHPRKVMKIGILFGGDTDGGTEEVRDRSYCGDPMMVLELCYPFVVVINWSKYGGSASRNFTFDLREVEIMGMMVQYAFYGVGEDF